MNPRSPRTIPVLFAAVIAACGSNNEPAPRGVPGGVDRPVIQQRAPAPKPEEEEAAEPEPSARTGLPSPFAPGPGDLMAPPGQPASEAAQPAEGEEKERDVGLELAEAARRTGCIDLAAAAKQPGGKLRLSVSAYVMPSGRITRATVNAPGQPSTALRCAEQRLVAMGVPGPFEKAESFSGETTVEVVGTPPPSPAQAAAPEPAKDEIYPNAPPAPYVENREPAPSQADIAQPSSDYSVTGTAVPDEQAGAP